MMKEILSPNWPDVIPPGLDKTIELSVMLFMFMIVVAIIRARDLIIATFLMSVFSLLATILYSMMGAPDVAMTEAAVGACLSTVIFMCAISITGRTEKTIEGNFNFLLRSFLLCCLVGAALVYACLDIPTYAASSNPIHEHVAIHYLRETGNEIGIPSVVAATLASYRGYDTLGETFVVLTAGMCVLMLLQREKKESQSMNLEVADIVTKTILKLIFPFIAIYALYIQVHGEQSPGGGFQAGAILASGVLLFAIVYSADHLAKHFSVRVLKLLSILGVLIYAGVGIASISLGGEFLNYSVLLPDSLVGQSIGIMIIELGVGITVASTMILIFTMFASRGATKIC
jgi:multicomponent Na+:H+ antiporter subunit B